VGFSHFANLALRTMGLELASHLPPFEGLLPKWLLLVRLQTHNRKHTFTVTICHKTSL
jgi:hypothetical protein